MKVRLPDEEEARMAVLTEEQVDSKPNTETRILKTTQEMVLKDRRMVREKSVLPSLHLIIIIKLYDYGSESFNEKLANYTIE